MSANEKSLIQIPGELEEGASYAGAIGVGDQVPANSVVEIAKQYKLYQIVQSSGHDNETELKASKLMLDAPETFMNFPLASILDPNAACEEREQELRLFSRKFTHGKEKGSLLTELVPLCQEVTKSESITNDIQLAVDELFTNAVYNAPYVQFEKNGPGRPRDEKDAKTDILRPGEFFVGRNESRIVIGCIDGYGALNPDALLGRLRECYDRGASDAMNMGPGGAGLGLFLIYQSSCSIYVGVSAGQKTIICCAFSLERRAKTRAAIPKNLHLCTNENAEEKKGRK